MYAKNDIHLLPTTVPPLKSDANIVPNRTMGPKDRPPRKCAVNTSSEVLCDNALVRIVPKIAISPFIPMNMQMAIRTDF